MCLWRRRRRKKKRSTVDKCFQGQIVKAVPDFIIGTLTALESENISRPEVQEKPHKGKSNFYSMAIHRADILSVFRCSLPPNAYISFYLVDWEQLCHHAPACSSADYRLVCLYRSESWIMYWNQICSLRLPLSCTLAVFDVNPGPQICYQIPAVWCFVVSTECMHVFTVKSCR